MTISSSSSSTSSNWQGLKEFANGDTALFNDDTMKKSSGSKFQDEIEFELNCILNDKAGNNFNLEYSLNSFESFNSDLSSFDLITDDFYTTPELNTPTNIASTTAMKTKSNQVKFEEDPLSAILNIEQSFQTDSEKKIKKRGRPPIIRFKPVNAHHLSVPENKVVSKIKNNENSPELKSFNQQKLELRDRRSDDDQYSPIWIRGRGNEREGLCPVCEPSHWFKIKQSAYWYHMNFYHGISAATGKPYKRPISYRFIPNPTSSCSNKVEGHCGNCLQWVLISTEFKGSNLYDTNEPVSLASWYKHAQKCHYRTKEFRIPF